MIGSGAVLIQVRAVRLLQGESMRSCTVCGEVEHVVWFVDVGGVEKTRCTRHAAWEVVESDQARWFAVSAAHAYVSDDTLAGDLVEGVSDMVMRYDRPAVARHLNDLWDMGVRGYSDTERLHKARFLIGAVAFTMTRSLDRPHP